MVILYRHRVRAVFLARRCGRLAASHEAAAQFVRGIEILQEIEPGAERDALELDLQIGRGSACAAAFGYPAGENEQAWIRAIELLRDKPEDPRNFWARRGLSSVHSCRADMAA
jgi:hypothetical protein